MPQRCEWKKRNKTRDDWLFYEVHHQVKTGQLQPQQSFIRITNHSANSLIFQSGCRRRQVWWGGVRGKGALGHHYVKNYLYSRFMISSGGVCFKVLPRDRQCVTKMQTYGALKCRNRPNCMCLCIKAPKMCELAFPMKLPTNDENRRRPRMHLFWYMVHIKGLINK